MVIGKTVNCKPATVNGYQVRRERPMEIERELLEILACPKCKGDIRLNEDESRLICDKCKVMYEIRDGIPVMLISEAIHIDQSRIEP